MSPAQQLVKIVHDELVAMLGERREGLKLELGAADDRDAGRAPGIGQNDDRGQARAQAARPRVARRGWSRPTCTAPPRSTSSKPSAPSWASPSTPIGRPDDVVRIAKQGIEQARRARDRVVIIDTAGRLQIDEEMMRELTQLKEAVHPDEILLVADGMTGQDAVRIAQGFDQRARRDRRHPHQDGWRRARRCCALDLRRAQEADQVHRRGREDWTRSRISIPDRMASRILQMGDVLTLVEKAQSTFDEDEAKQAGEESPQGRTRPPGFPVGDAPDAEARAARRRAQDAAWREHQDAEAGESSIRSGMKHLEAIVLSMTAEERRDPRNPQRVTAGTGGQGLGAADQRGQSAARAVPGHAEHDEEGGRWDARHARLPPGMMGLR